jgi:hypothetical protein
LKELGEAGTQAVLKEMHQLHNRKVLGIPKVQMN